MGVITLKIDDELERQLRQRAGERHGAAKGAISKSVEEALAAWLSDPRRHHQPERRFAAFVNGKKVAEEPRLKTLAEDLRQKGFDPRTVEIQTIPPEPKIVRLGLRTRPATG